MGDDVEPVYGARPQARPRVGHVRAPPALGHVQRVRAEAHLDLVYHDSTMFPPVCAFTLPPVEALARVCGDAIGSSTASLKSVYAKKTPSPLSNRISNDGPIAAVEHPVKMASMLTVLLTSFTSAMQSASVVYFGSSRFGTVS